MSQTVSTLKDLIAEKFGIARDELVADKPLDAFGLDSLSLVELMFTVEEHFGIDLPEDLGDDVRTLDALAARIDEALAGKPA